MPKYSGSPTKPAGCHSIRHCPKSNPNFYTGACAVLHTLMLNYAPPAAALCQVRQIGVVPSRHLASARARGHDARPFF